jgi:hypothetical protein
MTYWLEDPYGRPGIIPRIVNTVGGVANLANVINNWGVAKEQSQQETLANKLGMAQKISEMTGQPVPAEGLAPVMEKGGVPWPKVTEESRGQNIAGLLQGGAADMTTEGGKTVTSPVKQQTIMDQAPRVGQYVPIGEGKVPVYSTVGGVLKEIGKLPRNAKIIETDKNFTTIMNDDGTMTKVPGRAIQGKPSTTTFYDPHKNETVTVKGQNVKAMPRDPFAIMDYKEGQIRSRPTTEIDDETGLPMGQQTGKVHYKKGGVAGGNIKVMTESEAKAAGEVPKGTKIIKETDPEYSAARHEATTRVNANLSTSMLPEDQKSQKINELTSQIIQDRAGTKAERKGTAGGGASPPVDKLKEGHATTFSNGQKWTLQNGKPMRIQ